MKIQLKNAQRCIASLKKFSPDIDSSSVDKIEVDVNSNAPSGRENNVEEKESTNLGDDISDTGISFDDENSSEINSLFLDEEIRNELDENIDKLRFEQERK